MKAYYDASREQFPNKLGLSPDVRNMLGINILYFCALSHKSEIIIHRFDINLELFQKKIIAHVSLS